jgi:hypothetical protein
LHVYRSLTIFAGHLIDVREIIRGSFVGLRSSVHEPIVRDGLLGDLYIGIEEATALAPERQCSLIDDLAEIRA